MYQLVLCHTHTHTHTHTQPASHSDPLDGVGVETAGEAVKNKKDTTVHIRCQQRNGKKCITSIQGLANLHPDLDFKKLLKAFKKQFSCNGSIVEDKELGMNPRTTPPLPFRQSVQNRTTRTLSIVTLSLSLSLSLSSYRHHTAGTVLQLQGDQRDNASNFLTAQVCPPPPPSSLNFLPPPSSFRHLPPISTTPHHTHARTGHRQEGVACFPRFLGRSSTTRLRRRWGACEHGTRRTGAYPLLLTPVAFVHPPPSPPPLPLPPIPITLLFKVKQPSFSTCVENACPCSEEGGGKREVWVGGGKEGGKRGSEVFLCDKSPAK